MRKRLKVLRIQNELTQQEMADKIGVSRQSYQAIESGKSQGTFKFGHKLQDTFNIQDTDMGGFTK